MTYSMYDSGQSSPPPRPPQWAPPLPAARPAPRHGRKRAVQLWLIGALASLLVTLGIGLAVVLTKDPAQVLAEEPTQSAPGDDESQSDDRPLPSVPADCLVECTAAQPAPDGTGGEANYSGSVDAAVTFVQDIAAGNVAAAHEVLCGEGKNEFPTPADLMDDFYTTLGVSAITGVKLTGVHAADDFSDAVVFELRTDVGDITADVFIVEEAYSLTVCGYDVAP